MEDEDEVSRAVDPSLSSQSEEQQQPSLEPPEAEQHEISEQCGTVLKVADCEMPAETLPPVEAEHQSKTSPASAEREMAGPAEVQVVTLERDEKENEAENVKELETVDKKKIENVEELEKVENVEELEKVEEIQSENIEQSEKEGENKVENFVMLKTVGKNESESIEDSEIVNKNESEIVKLEELPPVTEELEVKNEELIEKREQMDGDEAETSVRLEEVEGDECVKAQEPPQLTEKVEVRSEEFIQEKAKENEGEVGGDGQGQVAVKQEEESKGEEVAGKEEAEEIDVFRLNGNDESKHVETKDEELVGEEETPTADAEMEVDVETEKSYSGGKRRRGRNTKAPARVSARKIVGEDVCFICLDGGDLVLCDRRGCPKAYHPSCVDHDEDFFRTKGRWNCGWHLCNKCGKNAYFMCYTCTFSLCKGCSKDAVIFCVRGNRGFCESCMKTVMMIENSEHNEMDRAAFDDRSSWEYLFKDYWIEQKGKLSLTYDELTQAKNPWKHSDASVKQQALIEVYGDNNDVDAESDSSLGTMEATGSKKKKSKRKSNSVHSDTDSSSEKDAGTAKRKAKRMLKSQFEESYSDSEHSSGNQNSTNKRGTRARRLSKSHSKVGSSARAAVAAANNGIPAGGTVDWASKELLEFVMHMKNGDKSVLSQFDVQELLLEYIKRNKLRDPRRQSQIICDSLLQKLFGKPRVGHFEMLKLLESHFLLKEDSQADDNQGSVVDSEISQLDADGNTDTSLDVGRSRGRKFRKRGEERGVQSNLDDYAAIDMRNINLIYVRRNLIDVLMEDSETFHDKVVGSFVRIRISGSSQKQDLYRLVQIIGTSKAAEPYRVGKRTTDVMLEILNLDKTEIIAIDTISNQEFTEDECKRLRQSIKCGLISRMTVGDVLEKARELQQVRVTDWLEAEVVRLSHLRDRASEKGRKKELRECVEKLQLLKTPEERQRRLDEIPKIHADPKMDPSCDSDDEDEVVNKRLGNTRSRESGFFRRSRDHFSSQKVGPLLNDSWSANARPPNKKVELNRNLSGKGFSNRSEDTAIVSPTSEHTSYDRVDRGTPQSKSWEKSMISSAPLTSPRPEYSGMRPNMSIATGSESSQSPSTTSTQTGDKVSETEKMWNYRDPSGKVQGPFSMVQLRKWSNTGYFPADLRVWKTSQTEDDSFLLTEALAGKFQKESPSLVLQSDTSKLSVNNRGSEYGDRHDSSNLPSPTPTRSTTGWGRKQTPETKRSTTSSPFQRTNQFRGRNERLPSPTPTSPSYDPSRVPRSNFSRQPRDTGLAGKKEENVGASVINPGTTASQQISSQSAVNVANQAFVPPDSVMNQKNLGPDAKSAVQPGIGQNPSVYNQGWASGYGARPETVNPNMTPNNPNVVPAQLTYGQWTGASVNNLAPSYGPGYPPGPGNMAANFPTMPPHNSWRPPPNNMPWGGQQQPPANPNMGWAPPPPPPGAAFGPSDGNIGGAMGQVPGPPPGPVSAVGWPGAGPGPLAGSPNPGWAPPLGKAGTWGGDQNRNGGGGNRNRHSSFGGGGQRGVCKFHENGHCRKGASCDYMHT